MALKKTVEIQQTSKKHSMTTAECIQFWTMVVTGSGVITALIFSMRQSYLMRQQMKVNEKQTDLMQQQMKVDLFADYTKRYQQIILNFPENINEDGFDLNKLKTSTKEEDRLIYNKTMRYMRLYFDLCSEEFFLGKNKKIEDDVWSEWKEGIKFTFTKIAFKDAWKIITKDSEFYEDFAVWINDVIMKKNNQNKT